MAASEKSPFASNDERVAFYTAGHCYWMAAAVHRLTGWPIVAVVSDCETSRLRLSDERALLHAMNRAPCGRLLDIEGLHEESDVIAFYENIPFTEPGYPTTVVDIDWDLICHVIEERNHPDRRTAFDLYPFLVEDAIPEADILVEWCRSFQKRVAI
jgi:hypothetical protein